MKCVVCGDEFLARRKKKTCSPKCSAIRKSKRESAYRRAHPEAQRIAHLRAREMVAHVSMTRKLNRAVRLLFALTGEKNYEQRPS